MKRHTRLIMWPGLAGPDRPGQAGQAGQAANRLAAVSVSLHARAPVGEQLTPISRAHVTQKHHHDSPPLLVKPPRPSMRVVGESEGALKYKI